MCKGFDLNTKSFNVLFLFRNYLLKLFVAELHFRFTKNLVISEPSSATIADRYSQKYRKRGKEKKRTKSEGSIGPALLLSTDSSVNVKSFIGAPLVSLFASSV